MRQGRFKLAMTLGRKPTDFPERVRICQEMGVTSCVTGPDLLEVGRDQYEAVMRRQKEEWAAAGFSIPVYETMTPVRADHIRRGTPGRDEELRNFIAAIEAMGRVGIPVLCYNLGQGGSRTDWGTDPGRGHFIAIRLRGIQPGAPRRGDPKRRGVVGQFDLAARARHPRRRKSQCPPGVPSQRPADFSVQGLGPDHGQRRGLPPPDQYRAQSRQRHNLLPGQLQGYGRRYLRRRPGSLPNRARFTSSTTAMSRAPPLPRFTETFHDDGPTDMARMLEIYARAGFEGPIRPDHAPTMGNEDVEGTRGYGMLGKIFAFGYMIGMMQARNLAYD